MLAVTEAATELLAKVIDDNNLEANLAVRLVAEDEGVAMKPDEAAEGDVSWTHGDRIVLLVDEQVAEGLDGHLMDVEDGSLTIRPLPAEDGEADDED